MVFAPAFAELDAEREVVLEEIAMYEDAPQELVHDLIADAVFGDHPLGRPVIGTAEVISSIPQRRDRALPRRDVRARRTSSSLPPGTSSTTRSSSSCSGRSSAATGTRRRARTLRPPLVQAPPPRLRFQRKDTEQYHVCLAAPGISRSDRRRFAASLLDAILGGSASSRLFQEIREKRGMAYAVYSFVSQYTDTGQIGIYLGTREDNLGDALAITAEQIADIAGGQPRPRELERAKENLKGRILLSMESTSTRMNRLGKSLITDSELLSLDRIVAEIDAVEAASVCELAAALLGAGAAVGSLHRPERGTVPCGARADHARPRARGVKILLNGRAAARSARCSPRGSRQRATCSSTRSPTPTRWSTSRAPDAVADNVRAAIARRRAERRRDDRLGHRSEFDATRR